MNGHYKLYQDTRSQWRWRYVAANGRTIADSGEGYYNRQDAINGIAIMKASYNSPVY
ncbi:YegP family protein [Sphingopyxis sp.]|uniref:YegP family protein n=1 Tax=Sphingopyxis sp. TaxID=1908224 RepID=UPI0035B466F3